MAVFLVRNGDVISLFRFHANCKPYLFVPAFESSPLPELSAQYYTGSFVDETGFKVSVN